MGSDEYELDETKSSKFNAGILSVERINKILADINFFKMRPSAYNLDYHDYNFALWIRNVDNLYDELDGFFEEEEQEIIKEMRKKITALMKQYPILETRSDTTKKSKSTIINEKNLEMFEELFRHYERKIRDLGIQHNVIAPLSDPNLEGL